MIKRAERLPWTRHRPLLLTGASGQLGSYLLRELVRANASVVAWSGTQQGDHFGIPLRPVDLADADRVAESFTASTPVAILHAAAISRIDQCYENPNLARQINTNGTQQLVELAAARHISVVYVSTDLVFDGEDAWYTENSKTSPTSVYGETKLAAERCVLDYSHGIVVRVSLLFGPSLSRHASFFDKQVAALKARTPLTLFHDEWRTPLSLSTAARGLLAVAASDYRGLLHFGGPERLSRLEMGRRCARTLGLNDSTLQPASRADIDFPEPRPRDTSLDSTRWRTLCPNVYWPAWNDAMTELVLA